jgi:hypothetical protein
MFGETLNVMAWNVQCMSPVQFDTVALCLYAYIIEYILIDKKDAYTKEIKDWGVFTS